MPKSIRSALLSGCPSVVDGAVQFDATGVSVRVGTVPDRDGLRLRTIETPMTAFAPSDLLTPDEIEAVEHKIAIAILADGETDVWMGLLFGHRLVGGAAA